MLLWDLPLAIAHGSTTYAEILRDIACFDQSRAPCCLIQIEFGMILKKVLYFLYFFGFTLSCNWFRWYKTNRELCVSILVLREKAVSKNLAILLINVIKSNSKLEKVYN